MGSSRLFKHRIKKYISVNGVMKLNPIWNLTDEQIISLIRSTPEIQGFLGCIINNNIQMPDELAFLIIGYIDIYDLIKSTFEIDPRIAKKIYQDEKLEKRKWEVNVSPMDGQISNLFFPFIDKADKRAQASID